MNDEWDLNQLQSITLSEGALQGETNTIESNVLIMKSMNNNDIDWLIRSSFSDSFQRKWLQFREYKQSDIGEWWLMIEFELDIPSLSEEGIEMEYRDKPFEGVRELHSSSMIDWLIMIEIVLLNHLSYSIVIFLLLKICCLCIHQYCGYQQSMNWMRFVVVLSLLWFKVELDWKRRHSICQIYLV